MVDVNANNGTGAVVGNGTTWYMEQVTAKLSATTDSLDQGYWVVQHADQGDAFHAFHLGPAGLDTEPVTTHSGTTYMPDQAPWPNVDRLGQLLFSPSGNLLAAVVHGPSLDTNKVELFQFHRSTGQLAHWASLGLRLPSYPGGPLNGLAATLVKGMDFGAGSDFLYLQLLDESQEQANLYVQYPLASPDSIAPNALNLLTTTLAMDQDCFDPFGNGIAMGPGNQLLLRQCYAPGTDMAQYLPALLPLPYTGGNAGLFHQLPPLYGMAPIAGFPSPCKRYLPTASGPAGVDGRAPLAAIGVRPNPLRDRATLIFNGDARPEQLIWRNALGQVVRQSAVGRTGPTYVLERGDLPAGLYWVEVQGGHAPLGVVAVACE